MRLLNPVAKRAAELVESAQSDAGSTVEEETEE
jgi:hypothetical protein